MLDYRKNIAEQLAAFTPYLSGNPHASVVVIQGAAQGTTPPDSTPPFSGENGLALDKAFARLGWGFGSQNTRIWLGITLAPPQHLSHQPALNAEQLRLICETVDPLSLVALDESARIALIDAFLPVNKSIAALFKSGAETYAQGRHLISVRNFEASLSNEKLKQQAWAELKRCVPPAIR